MQILKQGLIKSINLCLFQQLPFQTASSQTVNSKSMNCGALGDKVVSSGVGVNSRKQMPSLGVA